MIKDIFSVPLQPLKVMEFMNKHGNLRMADSDVLLLCDSLPDTI
jgi:hypothetical protein